jgi:hypothetical protein
MSEILLNKHLLIFLLNYTPNELLAPFQAAIRSKERIKRLLLSFVHDLHVEIYNTIWKTRNSKFKEWKIFNNISKKTFQNYRRRQTHNSPPSKDHSRRQPTQSSWQYRCPYSDDRRTLVITVMWIYFTSSNFLHNLPWYHSLDFLFSYFN